MDKKINNTIKIINKIKKITKINNIKSPQILTLKLTIRKQTYNSIQLLKSVTQLLLLLMFNS